MESLFPERGFAFFRNLAVIGLAGLQGRSDITVRQRDIGTSLSKKTLLVDLASALQVPSEWFGNINYDSFDEAIRDLDWLEFANLLFVLVGCSRQWASNYAAMSTTLEILVDAHLFWRQQGRGFFVAMVD
jgi:Barstar (barnase inhibitor)